MNNKEKEELRRRLRLDSDINDMERNIKENMKGEKIKSPKSNKRTLPPVTDEIKNIKPTRGKAKTTAMSRNALAWALEGHSTKIKMALEALFDKDPEAYINAVAKLMNYTVPKLSSSEITDNTSKRIKVDFNEDISVEELRKRLDEYND
tara:strand:- start:2038 stop:2484 length:447 start_codon:yes stop_codon:yes gene_type:complete